ncbi:MAG: hypothetical protein SGJ18_07755 [Pseudomonadota bacterium]|nr:hypothetical protein [Pseudomonadota bacterium]
MGEPTVIEKGIAHVYFAYDVGFAIDLERAQKRFTQLTERAKIRQDKRSPWYFEFEPQPVKISQTITEINIGNFATLPEIEATIFDFGAISMQIKIPFTGTLESLVDLSFLLYENEVLEKKCREVMVNLVNEIEPAIDKLMINEHFEEYKVFQITNYSMASPLTDFIKRNALVIAKILRSEQQDLSDDEIRDATSAHLGYTNNDLMILDWNTAILIDPKADDVRAVIEFANVELLQLSYLDLKLDNSLDRAYETASRLAKLKFNFPGVVNSELRKIGRLQIDSAFLFEGINNALKLLGDQYLARVYRMVSNKFHLEEWDKSILRKISALESIYEKVNDQSNTFRMELLEWIIVLLFIVSIVLPFITGVPH